MCIHHFHLQIVQILHTQSCDNCVLNHHHLQLQLQQLPRNGHSLVVTLKHQCNLGIHYLHKSHLPPQIFQTTSMSQTKNWNQTEIPILLRLLRVPQLLAATHLPLHDMHPSHPKLLVLMKVWKLQSLPISHTTQECVKRLNTTLSMLPESYSLMTQLRYAGY